MALNEACQLWIEQEMKAGLEMGLPKELIAKSIISQFDAVFEKKCGCVPLSLRKTLIDAVKEMKNAEI